MNIENSRIHITLKPETHNLLGEVAKKSSESLSVTAASLIERALELEEDAMLSQYGDERLKNTKKWIKHQEAWDNS